VGTIAAAREKRSGAGGGLQGSGHLVWLSFVSILELMFGATASYMVSLNVHAACCVGSDCNFFWHCFDYTGLCSTIGLYSTILAFFAATYVSFVLDDVLIFFECLELY
jgi:hypothetical protein